METIAIVLAILAVPLWLCDSRNCWGAGFTFGVVALIAAVVAATVPGV